MIHATPRSLLSAFLLLLLNLPLHRAYKIDTTCHGNSYNLVKRSVESAFEMARLAVYELNRPVPRGDNNVNRLIELLFCGQGEDPATKDMSKAKNIYQGIISMSSEREIALSRDSEVQNDVIIYCNMNRMEKNSEGKWYDHASKNIIEEEGTTACSSTDFETMGITWIPSSIRDFPEPRVYHPSEVTLCPWLLQFANKQQYKSLADIAEGSKRAVFHNAYTKMPGWLGGDTPIDALRLLDLTVLHELTHTKSGLDLEDVVIPGAGLLGRAKKGYGWKTIQKLAKDGGYREKDKKPMGPFDNADTMALFASAIRLLRMDEPLYVGADGNIGKTAPSKKRQESDIATVMANQSSAGFLTMIKEDDVVATIAPAVLE